MTDTEQGGRAALTPQQMRDLANNSFAGIIDMRAALRAAADDVDRLRASLVDATVGYNTQISRGNGLSRQVTELRAVIENAPHDRDAGCGFGVDPQDMSHCTCWKADVL